MTLRRKILLGLLVLPAATIIVAMALPGAGAELAFLVIGVPILVVNAWEFFLGGSGDSVPAASSQRPLKTGQVGSIMKTKWIAALLILSSVFLLLVIGYTVARSVVDEVPYFYALYTFLIKLGSKLWHFFSSPLIFISLLLFVLVVVAVPQILPLIRKVRDPETVPFPNIFPQPPQTVSGEAASQAGDIGPGLDKKVIQLMLEIDGIDMTQSYLLSKLQALEIHSEDMSVDSPKAQKEAFYHGVLDGLYDYLFPLFCSIETKNQAKVARFTLKPGVRERLMERLNPDEAAPEPASQ